MNHSLAGPTYMKSYVMLNLTFLQVGEAVKSIHLSVSVSVYLYTYINCLHVFYYILYISIKYFHALIHYKQRWIRHYKEQLYPVLS